MHFATLAMMILLHTEAGSTQIQRANQDATQIFDCIYEVG
jgi:hypothetical protein